MTVDHSCLGMGTVARAMNSNTLLRAPTSVEFIQFADRHRPLTEAPRLERTHRQVLPPTCSTSRMYAWRCRVMLPLNLLRPPSLRQPHPAPPASPAPVLGCAIRPTRRIGAYQPLRRAHTALRLFPRRPMSTPLGSASNLGWQNQDCGIPLKVHAVTVRRQDPPPPEGEGCSAYLL